MFKIMFALTLLLSMSAIACEGTKIKPKDKKPAERSI